MTNPAPILLPALLGALAVVSAPGAAPTQVVDVACDSLRLAGSLPGWEWLEADEGDGFLPLLVLPPGGSFTLTRPVPPHGGTMAWRGARLDESGLPAFSDEELWTRPFPTLEARLSGDRVSGQVSSQAGDCPLPDLLLRVELDGRVVDLLRVPPGPSFSLDLAGRPFTDLRLAWSGQRQSLRLGRPRRASAAPAHALEVDGPPPSPELRSLEPAALLLGSALPLEVTDGRGRLEDLGGGHWRLTPESGPLAVCAVDAAGRRSLPLLWELGKAGLNPVLERTGPGSLRLGLPAEDDGRGLELAWLDGRGRQGRQPLGAADVQLDELAEFCRLQILRDGESLWTQRLDLRWPAPDGLVATSASDTLLFLRLEDPRGWSQAWELEWREDGPVQRRSAAAELALRPAGGERIRLRWRAGREPWQSRWSPWRDLALWPDPPRSPRLRIDAAGLALSWEPGDWLEDRVEVQRVTGGDTLRVLRPAREGRWLDHPPVDALVHYRLRSVCRLRTSDWSPPLIGALPGKSSPADGPRLARRSLSVAEYQAYAETKGLELPRQEEWAEGRVGAVRAEQRLTGLSPREAVDYANWLNETLGLDGRTDARTGAWQSGTRGGYRLPATVADLDADVPRCWLLEPGGARAAGRSELRPQGSSMRLYSMDARQPDVGLALVWAPTAGSR